MCKNILKNKIVSIIIAIILICNIFILDSFANLSFETIEATGVNIIDVELVKEEKIKKGFVKENDGTYLYDDDSKLLTDYLYENNNKLYYIGANGKMVINTWVVISPGVINSNKKFYDTKDKVYYFGPDGVAYKDGKKRIDGTYYYFDNEGCLDVNKGDVIGSKIYSILYRKDSNYNIDDSLANLNIGNIVYFGTYTQSDNKNQDIRWRILDRRDDMVLLVSQYVLDVKKYDDEAKNNWEKSTIRRWLNNTFYYLAFKDDEELEKVVESAIYTDGIITNDKVFLLSSDEIKKYFGNEDVNGMNKKSATMATDKAREGGVFVSYNDEEWYKYNSSYYLRDMGTNMGMVKCIGVYGHLYEQGEKPDENNGDGVRPAVWVKIDKSKLSTNKNNENDIEDTIEGK